MRELKVAAWKGSRPFSMPVELIFGAEPSRQNQNRSETAFSRARPGFPVVIVTHCMIGKIDPHRG